MIDWDDAFDNSSYVAGSKDLETNLLRKATVFREELMNSGFSQLDLRYGGKERCVFDFFKIKEYPETVIVFIHGGYWHQLSKDHWSHLAYAALKNDLGFAIPSYNLAPAATLVEIAEEIGQFLEFLAHEVSSKFILVGHSAGGHLVTRMTCKSSNLKTEVRNRILRTISVSGIYDLKPLLNTKLNDILGIDLDIAKNESPVFLEPLQKSNLIFWVGAEERPEFLRQAGLIYEKWKGFDINSEINFERGKNHFSVIDDLEDQNSYLFKRIIGE